MFYLVKIFRTKAWEAASQLTLRELLWGGQRGSHFAWKFFNKVRVFVVIVQSLSHVQLFVTPWTAALQVCLSFTISQSLLKFVSFESVMLSNNLILCHPFLLLPSIFPSKISCLVSTCVSSDDSFLNVRQEPSFGPWKGSPFLQQYHNLKVTKLKCIPTDHCHIFVNRVGILDLNLK